MSQNARRSSSRTSSRHWAVTSGNVSPTLGGGVALALVEPEVAEGDAVEIDIRGSLVPARVVPLPFVGR